MTRAATSSCRNCTITIALLSCKRSTAGLVFTIPFQRDFTLIGTTDQSFAGDPAIVVPTEAEIDYLCSIVSTYFRVSIVTADAVWALPGGNFAYDAIATLVECAL